MIDEMEISNGMEWEGFMGSVLFNKTTTHQTSTLQVHEYARHDQDEVINAQTAVHNEFTSVLVMVNSASRSTVEEAASLSLSWVTSSAVSIKSSTYAKPFDKVSWYWWPSSDKADASTSSIAMMNNNGDNRSPCLTPCWYFASRLENCATVY